MILDPTILLIKNLNSRLKSRKAARWSLCYRIAALSTTLITGTCVTGELCVERRQYLPQSSFIWDNAIMVQVTSWVIEDTKKRIQNKM